MRPACSTVFGRRPITDILNASGGPHRHRDRRGDVGSPRSHHGQPSRRTATARLDDVHEWHHYCARSRREVKQSHLPRWWASARVVNLWSQLRWVEQGNISVAAVSAATFYATFASTKTGPGSTANETGQFPAAHDLRHGTEYLFEIYGDTHASGGVPVQTYPVNHRSSTGRKPIPSTRPVSRMKCKRLSRASSRRRTTMQHLADAARYGLGSRSPRAGEFSGGRKVYVEYDNEPGTSPSAVFYYHRASMGPCLPPGLFQGAHYPFRAFQVHAIFRSVFTAAGRGNEIVGILNCQMGSPDSAPISGTPDSGSLRGCDCLRTVL